MHWLQNNKYPAYCTRFLSQQKCSFFNVLEDQGTHKNGEKWLEWMFSFTVVQEWLLGFPVETGFISI